MCLNRKYSAVLLFLFLNFTKNITLASNCKVECQNGCMNCTTSSCLSTDNCITDIGRCYYECELLTKSDECSCHRLNVDTMSCFGPVAYLQYSSTLDTIHFRYKICKDDVDYDTDEYIGISINCSEYDGNVNLSIPQLYTADMTNSFINSNVTGLKASTNYICCLTPEWISAILTPIACMNISTKEEHYSPPKANETELLKLTISATRVSAKRIRVESNVAVLSELPAFAGYDIFYFKTQNKYECYTAGGENWSHKFIDISNNLSYVIKNLDPQSPYCISVILRTSESHYQSLSNRTYVSVYENSVIRIFFANIASCLQWTQIGTQKKLNGIKTNLVDTLSSHCECDISQDYLLNSHFESCGDAEQQTVFNSHVIGHMKFNSSQLVTVAKLALEKNASMIIDGVEIKILLVCISKDHCSTMETMFQDPQSIIPFTFLLCASVFMGVLALMLSISIICIVVLCTKYKRLKRKQQPYSINQMEVHLGKELNPRVYADMAPISSKKTIDYDTLDFNKIEDEFGINHAAEDIDEFGSEQSIPTSCNPVYTITEHVDKEATYAKIIT